MLFVILFIVVAILILSFTLILRRLGGGRKFPWLRFYNKGHDSGFSLNETNLLRKVAVETHVARPLSLFWSVSQLDRSIRTIITKARLSHVDQDPNSINFIAKLFNFRKKVEFDKPRYRLGIKSTRNLKARQRISIVLPGYGRYSSVIIENLRKYLAISYPEGKPLPPGFSWRGQKVNVYLWRAEDAGYFFQAKILDDFFDKNYSIVHLSHSDNMVRSQKRNSIRVMMTCYASLYTLKNINLANDTIETKNGLRCRMVDLSEDGAALLIGGKGHIGMAVKLQFKLSSDTIVMCGLVKGITFNKAKNQSILHIQAASGSLAMRNNILSYVYNIFKEQETGIPISLKNKN